MLAVNLPLYPLDDDKYLSFTMTAIKPSPYLHLFISSLLLLLATSIPTTNAAAGDTLPETVIQERLDEAPQVLLIQTTDGGIATSVLKDSCGNDDTYYTTSALVLGDCTSTRCKPYC